MQNKVLLIEDGAETQLIVRKLLDDLCQLQIAGSAATAKAELAKNQYDLIILDVGLPDINGFELCAELKNHEQTKNTPIFFLTGKAALNEKILGFSLGADDYIVKPFEPLEFKARVDAKLRNISQLKEIVNILKRGPIKINISNHEVYLLEGPNETKLSLTPYEFKLLLKLIQNEGRILSRQQLLDTIWGNDTFVEDRTVDKHISALRKKLGTCANHIETVSGLGYKFGVVR